MFNMRFTTNSRAFDEGEGEYEISRIMREVADRYAQGEREGSIRDVNGNTVGEWSWQ